MSVCGFGRIYYISASSSLFVLFSLQFFKTADFLFKGLLVLGTTSLLTFTNCASVSPGVVLGNGDVRVVERDMKLER